MQDRNTMALFYHTFIESSLSFFSVSWFASLSVKNKNSLNHIVKRPCKLIGESQLNLGSLCTVTADTGFSAIICTLCTLRFSFSPLDAGGQSQGIKMKQSCNHPGQQVVHTITQGDFYCFYSICFYLQTVFFGVWLYVFHHSYCYLLCVYALWDICFDSTYSQVQNQNLCHV